MAIELDRAGGSPYCWRVQLGLDDQALAWESRPVDFAT
jgi:hypothetical protein